MSIQQQINFTGKIEEDDGATMFAEKQQKINLNFFLDSLIVSEWYKKNIKKYLIY